MNVHLPFDLFVALKKRADECGLTPRDVAILAITEHLRGETKAVLTEQQAQWWVAGILDQGDDQK